jgi:hypothetical protein
MRKAVFGVGVLLVLGFIFAGCATGSTRSVNNELYGVWLITASNLNVWDDGSKQPTPAAIGLTNTISAPFGVVFKKVENYGDSANPAWAFKSPETAWTAVAGDYYVLIVPVYYPGGVPGQGDFEWVFDEVKISGSGAEASPISIPANKVDFTPAQFVNMSDLSS